MHSCRVFNVFLTNVGLRSNFITTDPLVERSRSQVQVQYFSQRRQQTSLYKFPQTLIALPGSSERGAAVGMTMARAGRKRASQSPRLTLARRQRQARLSDRRRTRLARPRPRESICICKAEEKPASSYQRSQILSPCFIITRNEESQCETERRYISITTGKFENMPACPEFRTAKLFV